MAFNVSTSKEEGLAQLTLLVSSFNDGYSVFKDKKYNETQLRNDFIDPFLKCFGWDVDNEASKNQFSRDVIQEESICVEDEKAKKNPDYTLRISGLRKIFVEAKKPSVDITNSSKSAFQVRRYGWNANLGISILINFEYIVVYDCRPKPVSTDDVRVARIKVFEFSNFVDCFDEIYGLISYEVASNGCLDDLYSVYEREKETFDSYFLTQIEGWRKKLAESAVFLNSQINNEGINLLIQRLINRIIFLRICEDRTIEKYETLKKLSSYQELKSLFDESDKKYNSGLFDFIDDDLSMRIEIDSDVLIEIFNELYFPFSPYDFSVVDPTILSQIYEKFLGSYVVVDDAREVSLVEEPEVVASNGVVPTPKIVVEKIVEETLTPVTCGKSLEQLFKLKIADICCGSGTFLITAYDFLIKAVIEKLIEEGNTDKELIYEASDGSWVLTLKCKRILIENCIFGVDINPYAAEVSQFSLLLKLLEGETGASLGHYIAKYKAKVLPDLRCNIKCGNSIVDGSFYEFMPRVMDDDDLLYKVRPFDWNQEFPFLNQTEGFDAIVGNPPYVRIQNLVKYSPEETEYFKHGVSGFGFGKKEAIDKYYVFIKRAISLLNKFGFIGYIVPNKFFIIKSGKGVRKFISDACSISKVINFGVTQVFPERSTYTTIIVLQKEQNESFLYKKLNKIAPNLLSPDSNYTSYLNSDFRSNPWVFVSQEVRSIFDKLKLKQTELLKDVAQITVGLQTSADKIFIFTPNVENEDYYFFEIDGMQYQVEKDVCLPCIYDLTFDLFDSVSPNAMMIFPYNIVDGDARVIDESYFSAHYPCCWSYLNEFKEQLERRSINGGRNPKWYQFGRSQSLTKFHDSPKLIWTVLATGSTYVHDTQNLQFTGGGNGPYYSLISQSESELLYLMAILSHPLIECMVQAGASEFRGAYYSHGKQFIANLPIRKIDQEDPVEVNLYNDIVALVRDLISVKIKINSLHGDKKNIIQRKFDVLNNKRIQLINELYGIDDQDVKTVLDDGMFRGELEVVD